MEKISLKERMSYGLGDLACNLLFQLVSAYLMFFYTDVAGISLGAVGVIMLVSRVVDAVTDPMMGVIVDKTNTKWGKARPYILWMSVPFALMGIAMFYVPAFSGTGKFVYAMITYILFCVAYTALNIPYTTMLSCMTDNESDRLSFNMFKGLGSNIGGFIVMGGTLALVGAIGGGNQAKGFLGTVTIFGIVGVVLLFICFKNTKERIFPSEKEKISVVDSLKTAAKNKYWIILSVLVFVTFTGMIIKSQSTMYFTKYYLENEGIASTLMTLPTIVAFLMTFMIPYLAKKLGKRNCVIIGNLCTIAGAVVISLAGKSIEVIIAGTLLAAIGTGAGIGVIFVMGAETVDYTEWQTGKRPQGIMTAIQGFMCKLGMACAGIIGAQILSAGGYVENAVQTESAISAIRISFIWVPAIASALIVILLLFYDLDKKYGTIINELHKRRGEK